MVTRFYLDTRRANKEDGTFHLKLVLQSKGTTALICLGVYLTAKQWNPKTNMIVKHKDERILNTYIQTLKMKADNIILANKVTNIGKLQPVTELRRIVEYELFPDRATNAYTQRKEAAANKKKLFMFRLMQFADRHINKNTREMYIGTGRRIHDFMEGKEAELRFEDITKSWLMDFEKFMSKTACQNARNIHLRNIRAVFNDAIDDNITTAYPFRTYKIRTQQTAKRSLDVNDLRKLFNYKEVEDYARFHLDIFKLSFYLIGINMTDLCNLKEIVDGRVEYHRSKTGRLYSIKVEPEALEIINRYRGKNWLLCMHDTYNNPHDYIRHINEALKKIGEVKRVGRGGRKIIVPLFPKLTTYWARHTWASIAASLDIPRDTIAHALGHGGNTVTDIYIDFDSRKVDDANRLVLDYVLYGNSHGIITQAMKDEMQANGENCITDAASTESNGMAQAPQNAQTSQVTPTPTPTPDVSQCEQIVNDDTIIDVEKALLSMFASCIDLPTRQRKRRKPKPTPQLTASGKKRGRPKKPALMSVVYGDEQPEVKKKRGRPRKVTDVLADVAQSVPVTDVGDIMNFIDKTPHTIEVIKSKKVDEVVKRKVGRPRKETADATSARMKTSQSLQPKRGRGRPRKVPEIPTEKRKRGRPRKNAQ
jgi:hypothetical protein